MTWPPTQLARLESDRCLQTVVPTSPHSEAPAIVRERLDQIYFVGLPQRRDDLVALLRWRSGWQCPTRSESKSISSDCLEISDISQEDLDLHLELNYQDFPPYERAKVRFQAGIAAMLAV